MSDDKAMTPSGAIVLGAALALAGVGIVAIAFFARGDGFQAPRWVVASLGGAFLFFGGWTAAVYALGYDPARSEETLPSAGVQLLVLIPGLLFFAAPFHWVAFGPGPRKFSGTVSVPFVSVGRSGSELVGRLMFALGALLVDAMIVAAVVRLVRQARRPRPPRPL